MWRKLFRKINFPNYKFVKEIRFDKTLLSPKEIDKKILGYRTDGFITERVFRGEETVGVKLFVNKYYK